MRVQKDGSQGLVNYTYDDDSVLIQTDNLGTTLAKYEYGPDRLLSLNHTTEGRQYYHFDALGSTVNLTKPDASLQARYQYDAFGNFRSEVGSSWNNFGFTGHEKDVATNLIYFKARYYDPDTGAFISQDPYLGEANTPPSLNRYLYAYSNPTVWVDLTGYSPRKATEKALEESVKNSAGGSSSAAIQRQNDCGQGCVYKEIEAVKEFADQVKSGYENAQRILWRFLLNRLPVPNTANSEFDGKQEQLISNGIIPTSTSSPIPDQNTGIALENPGGAGVELEQNYEGRPSNPITPEMPSGDADPLPDVRPSPRPNQEGLIPNTPMMSEEQDKLPRVSFSDENDRSLGDKPKGMKTPHRHHVLDVNGRLGEHRTIVREGQDILKSYDIDPLQGNENLVWAPNKGHTKAATQDLVDDLRNAKEIGLNRDSIVKILKTHGQKAAKR